MPQSKLLRYNTTFAVGYLSEKPSEGLKKVKEFLDDEEEETDLSEAFSTVFDDREDNE